MTQRLLYKTKRQQGFTLVEMMVGMVILATLMLAFTQIFGSSLRASNQINSRNELVYEGQIAQQLIASRLQSAVYVYPVGQSLNLTANSTTTKNTIRSGAGQNWLIGTDPFLALLLPPSSRGICPATTASATTKESGKIYCYTFYAYYPIRRSVFIADNPTSAPPLDANNANTWVLIEYKVPIFDSIDRTSDQLKSAPTTSGTFDTYIKGKSNGTMLIDYVQPLNSAAPYNRMFAIDPINRVVEFNLRLLQNRGGKALTAPSSTTPLSTRVYPRNWN